MIRLKHIPKNRPGELPFEEDRNSPGAGLKRDLAGIALVIIQHEELARPYGEPMTVDGIPFLARENGFQRQTADMVGTARRPAKGIKDHILLPEPVEMGLFVETGSAMVGQLRKVHGKK